MQRFPDFIKFILLLLFFIIISILFPYLKGPAPTQVESGASESSYSIHSFLIDG